VDHSIAGGAANLIKHTWGWPARPKHVVWEARKENEEFPIKGILKTNKIVASRWYKTQLWQT
jgi:hypothetical protein